MDFTLNMTNINNYRLGTLVPIGVAWQLLDIGIWCRFDHAKMPSSKRVFEKLTSVLKER